MIFDELILSRLGALFEIYNLSPIDQSPNFIKLKSDKVTLSFSHNPLDNSNAFEAGGNKRHLYAINQNVIKEVFNSDIRIDDLTLEEFAGNLEKFFKTKGQALLNGSASVLDAIEKYVYKESEGYTLALTDNQNFDAANKAWDEGDYKGFIKYLDKMVLQKLPPSYQLKYKMAYKRLKI